MAIKHKNEGTTPHSAKKQKTSAKTESSPDEYKDAVFVPMCCDFIHQGHVNILNGASKLGPVYVLLMTDEAMVSYKRAPMMPYTSRKIIVESMQQVTAVMPCHGPQDYLPKVREFSPGIFYHGDDWKIGPQKQARAEVIATVESYGGHVVEPAYTKDVSSTMLQSALKSDTNQKKHRGTLVRTALNDCKRIESTVATETKLGAEVLSRVINGKEFEDQTIDATCSLLQNTYPIPAKHLVCDKDTSDNGVWVMRKKETEDSGRVLGRTNKLGQHTDYYRYMDTATAALAPFKPELIEELVHVTDNDPYNPLVVMNKGHLLGQLTVFIGPVNFYCTIRGKTHCKPMNTGDSCLITPYVPHSFTSRDPAQFAAICAVTFSGHVRDVLGDLVHHDINEVMATAGNCRQPASVLKSLIARFAELRGLSPGDLAAKLVSERKCDEADVAATMQGARNHPEVLSAICAELTVPPSALEVLELEEWEEVTYNPPPEHKEGAQTHTTAYAASKHLCDMGGFELFLCGPRYSSKSQFFNYLYNHGETVVHITTQHGNSTKKINLNPGDSAVLKPFIEAEFKAEANSSAKLIVCKVPGSLNRPVMHEMALFAEESLAHMTSNKAKWY